MEQNFTEIEHEYETTRCGMQSVPSGGEPFRRMPLV